MNMGLLKFPHTSEIQQISFIFHVRLSELTEPECQFQSFVSVVTDGSLDSGVKLCSTVESVGYTRLLRVVESTVLYYI